MENYDNVLLILKKNILNLGYQESSTIIENNIVNNLSFQTLKKKFDIIFLDPPYKEKELPSVLNDIIKSNILNDQGIIVVHRHRKEEDKFPEKFNIIEEKTYGISKVIFGNYI